MRLPRVFWSVIVCLSLVLVLGGRTRAAEAGRKVDVVIYGATPGGIATAVRAAREGLTVVLAHHHRHIGGMMVNGLGVLDTMYEGYRAPIFDELKADILAHYPQHRRGDREYRKYEPHVAEKLLEGLVAKERGITVIREFYPAAAKVEGRRIASVTFRAMNGPEEVTWRAASFVDASYEGDLASVAGAKMVWGRESRDDYGEPHAGHIFTKMNAVGNPRLFQEEGINVNMISLEANVPLPGSTGKGDEAIQAFNFRVCWSRDPENRTPVTKPARYERDVYLDLKSRWKFTNRLPKGKTSWNAPLLIGGNHDYPNADWPTRQAITARHRDLAMGLLWFMQNDPVVPEETREEARQWGLPKDEFQDNGGFPWEMYVREARRLVGRKVFTQHDGMAAEGIKRAPVYADSIAITEWPLDSHACTLESAHGSDHEGKVLLAVETRPGQVSYQCLLPRELDNLLVTGCVSSTHIGWGTIRLEPVWMQIGESAGHALALAKKLSVDVAQVPTDPLLRRLVESRIMLGLLNEFDMRAPTPAQRAAQYFTTKGFFPGYDAKLDRPLTRAVAEVWARPGANPMITAKKVFAAESVSSPTITAADLSILTRRSWPSAPTGPLTRGDACAWLFENSARH